jgi:hypothetical protein
VDGLVSRQENIMNATSAGSRWKRAVSVAACVMALSASASHRSAVAQQLPPMPEPSETLVAAMHPADLEKAFWICDYTATVAGVQATPIALCTAVWHELKQARFGGSFEDLLAWWQLNKATEHAALATSVVAYQAQD